MYITINLDDAADIAAARHLLDTRADDPEPDTTATDGDGVSVVPLQDCLAQLTPTARDACGPYISNLLRHLATDYHVTATPRWRSSDIKLTLPRVGNVAYIESSGRLKLRVTPDLADDYDAVERSRAHFDLTNRFGVTVRVSSDTAVETVTDVFNRAVWDV